jgi:exodeoxyribonuclease-3
LWTSAPSRTYFPASLHCCMIDTAPGHTREGGAVVKDIRILCWNINGIRAAARKGFLDWLGQESPDIICLQETRAQPEQLDQGILEPSGYQAYWYYPETRGYSGVATFTKEKPQSVTTGLGIDRYDIEARALITEYPDFVLMNIYFPNGKKNAERLQYKMDFYRSFLKVADDYKAKGKGVIVCGDFNTAHKEVDIARPRENEKVSGFLPMEREWIDQFIAHGFVDTFRQFHTDADQYTWWDLKTRARERNVGWRIDYFFVSENLVPSLKDAFIMPEVMGSDHCPIGIVVRTP